MVSVIIPIYNIEQVLEVCVKSVLKQTYTDLEVLLVDDGSKDGSSAICDKFAASDLRVRALHKPNGGLSDARNYGLQHATGEYILYLDGDDWLDPDAISVLYNKAQAYHADMVQSGYSYAYDDFLLTRKDTDAQGVLTKDEALLELLQDGIVKNFAWGNLMKRELALKVSFVKGKYFEDIYWKYKIIDHCHRFAYVQQPLFYYRQRGNSISAAFSVKNLDLLEGGRQRLEFMKEKYPTLFPIALREHWMQAFDFMNNARNLETQIAARFESYFVNLHALYTTTLPQAVKGDKRIQMYHWMYCNCRRLHPVFALGDRICRKFKPATYVRTGC